MKLIANDLHSLFCNEKTDEIYFAQLKNKVFGSLHESEKPLNGWKHDATIVYVSQLATLSTLTTLMNKSTWTSLPMHRYSKNSRTKFKVEARPRPADTNEVPVSAHVRHHQLHYRRLHYYRYWESRQRMLSPRTNQLCALHKNSTQHCLIWGSHFTAWPALLIMSKCCHCSSQFPVSMTIKTYLMPNEQITHAYQNFNLTNVGWKKHTKTHKQFTVYRIQYTQYTVEKLKACQHLFTHSLANFVAFYLICFILDTKFWQLTNFSAKVSNIF